MRLEKFNLFASVAIAILVITLIIACKVPLMGAIARGEAFGHPGACPTWSASTLTFLGTAQNPNSKVWFTGFNGIIGEVFYPSADKPATVDWQFLVGDAAKTWVDEEKRDTTSQVTLNNPRSLSWNVTNTAKNGKYQIQKTIFTDPNRNTFIQQVTFSALSGKLGNLNLYTLYHPAIANEGRSTTGYSTTYNGIPMQVWDLNAPSGYTPGTPTKAMTPLIWLMGEYIKLFASNRSGKMMDRPEIVYQRYAIDSYKPHEGKAVDYNLASVQQGRALTIYYKGFLANSKELKLHWGYDNWQAIADNQMLQRSDGFWETTISVPATGSILNFAFTDGINWDNNGGSNWNETISPGSLAALNAPVDK